MNTEPEQYTAMDEEGTWNIEVRPQCFRCERLAIVYDDKDRPLCGRHGTIFMVANKPRIETPTDEE